MPYNLHKTLKKLRLGKELTQAQLAYALGISTSHLCELESAKKKPSLQTLQRYSDFFGQSRGMIVWLSEQEPSSSP